MSIYGCEVLNCPKPAKVGGKCVEHAREDAKKREAGTVTEEKEERKPICGRCGKEKPEDKRFSFKKKRCNSCQVIEANEKKKLAVSNPQPQKAEGRRQKAEGRRQKAEKPSQREAVFDGVTRFIGVDFAQYPEVHEKLLAAAIDNVRSPEMQILFCLKTVFGE